MTALNPVMRIGSQIAEAQFARTTKSLSRDEVGLRVARRSGSRSRS